MVGAAWYKNGVRSMPGYGRGRAEHQGNRVSVEVRSVNHRFLDLKMRGGHIDPAIEEKISSRVRQRVARGSVSVTLRIEVSASEGGISTDLAAARRAKEALAHLAGGLNLPREVPFSLIVQQPGILSAGAREADVSLIETALMAVDVALEGLLAMLT